MCVHVGLYYVGLYAYKYTNMLYSNISAIALPSGIHFRQKINIDGGIRRK